MKRGRKSKEYDVYHWDEYVGRYTRAEIVEAFGIPRGTVDTLIMTGRTSLCGYEIMSAEIPGFQEAWRAACERLKPRRMKEAAG